MRPITVALTVLLAATSAEAAALRYAWQPGQTYRFVAQSQDQSSMSGMGMNTSIRTTTTSRFAIRIARLRGNVAEGQVLIEGFEVRDDGGRLLAGLDGLPPGALSNAIEIDDKGRFTFKETVYLVVDESGNNVLVSAKGSPGSVSAKAQAGDEEVEVYAEFDPRTGQLRGGYSVKKIGQKKKKVAVKPDKPKVELLPAQFLAMLVLPDGSVELGQQVKVEMMGTTIELSVVEASARRAKIRYQIGVEADVGAPVAAAAADTDADADDAEDDFGGSFGAPGGAMPMGMPGMGAMPGGGGFPGMGGGAAGGGGQAMGVKMTGDFTMTFDVSRGMLDRVDGTMTGSTSVGGMMKIDTTSVLELRAVN